MNLFHNNLFINIELYSRMVMYMYTSKENRLVCTYVNV